MAYVTKATAITLYGRTWPVNSKPSGLITHMVKAMIGQVIAMASHHNKIHVLRFDLRIYEYTPNNKMMTDFNRRFFRWLKRKYNLKRVGFIWCREIETAKQQHYHCVLIVDGCKVRYPYEITKKLKELAHQLGRSEYFPDNCYYNVKRNDFNSLQDAIWRISYLAKARGKGYKAPQAKNYSCSRINPKLPA